MTDDNPAPAKKSTLKDRRKAKRHPSGNYKAVVTLKQLLGSSKYINVKVLNISAKGARFSSKYKFLEKTKILLNFKIQGEDKWKVPAKIVGIYSDSEYGIFFDRLQDDLVEQLLNYEAGYRKK